MGSNDFITETCDVLNDDVKIVTQIPQTSKYKTIYTIAIVMCAILTVTTVCLNACTVITIRKTRILKDKLPNFTIMIQSAIDLLHGALAMPMFTYVMVTEATGTGNCYVMYVCKKLASLIFLVSLSTFSMMNHERYMGICYPLVHRARMTKRFLLKYVAVGATLQTLGLSLTLYYNHISYIVLGSSSLIFLAHTIFVYIRIGCVILSKAQVNENRRTASERSKLMRYLSDIKATKTCFIIVFCCIACNLPGILTFSGMISMKSIAEAVILRRCFYVLIMFNSSLNSILLFWRDKKLRIYAKIPRRTCCM